MTGTDRLRAWTPQDRLDLREAVKQGSTLGEIAKALDRSTSAVTAQAYKLGLAILT